MLNDVPPATGTPARQHVSSGPNLLRRLLQLGICVVAGSVIGFVGQHLTGNSQWFLAVPAFVLVGWLFVANPTECLPPTERSSHNGSAPT
jgi:hypothetical protein